TAQRASSVEPDFRFRPREESRSSPDAIAKKLRERQRLFVRGSSVSSGTLRGRIRQGSLQSCARNRAKQGHSPLSLSDCLSSTWGSRRETGHPCSICWSRGSRG